MPSSPDPSLAIAAARLIHALAILCAFSPATLTAQTPHESWQRAKPGWNYTFPRDEYAHPDFKTEWWYFTGNLDASDGTSSRAFGYQLTIFRQGIRPPALRPPVESQFVVDDFWFAHLAVTDVEGREFHHAGRIVRGSHGEAGSDPATKRAAWLRDWQIEALDPNAGHYRLVAHHRQDGKNFGLELDLRSDKPPVFHGANGISAKAADPSNASHYYSFTRLETTGTLHVGKEEHSVTGWSWLDREWSTSLLDDRQVGWDWFSIQLDDDWEIMLFQLRRSDGSADFTSGTLVAPGGAQTALPHGSFNLRPAGQTWRRGRSGPEYPIAWEASIPAHDLQLTVEAVLPNQELHLGEIAYWEGTVRIRGTRGQTPIRGRGYLEMTGYEGPIPGLGD